MHTVFALLCFVVVIPWLIFPYPSGLLHWHCGNLTIAPVPTKQPWWIWINTSCKFIMNDCITTTKQSTTKPCAYFLGYTVAMALKPFNNIHLFIFLIFHIAYIHIRLSSINKSFVHKESGLLPLIVIWSIIFQLYLYPRRSKFVLNVLLQCPSDLQSIIQTKQLEFVFKELHAGKREVNQFVSSLTIHMARNAPKCIFQLYTHKTTQRIDLHKPLES